MQHKMESVLRRQSTAGKAWSKDFLGELHYWFLRKPETTNINGITALKGDEVNRNTNGPEIC